MNPAIFPHRLATGADAEALLVCMADFNAADGIPFEAARTRPALGRLLADDRLGRVTLREEAGEIVAYAVVTWGWDLEFDGRDAWLTELWVAPGRRGAGLGRALVGAVEQVCVAHEVHALHLMVRAENAPAQAVYAALGYAPPPRLTLSKRLDGG